jgi:hypothetical protein
LAAGTATAQIPARPDLTDPEARVPAPTYRSAFEGFRRLEETPRTDWRQANDEAARIGGHIGVLRDQAAREKQAQGERK